MNYKFKQWKYRKAIEVLSEIFDRKKDNILDNPDDELFKNIWKV